MSLKIYNSLTKQKETFKPITPGKVAMYVCGMTVYDYCHMGHARMILVFDMVARYLRYQGYQVQYVRNITDIDDKIIRRANENHEAYQALTNRFIKAMHQDLEALNILPPDQQPRATEHVEQMLTLIKQLVDQGIAYQASNGDVMYSVKKFPGYGKLSHRDLTELRSGARVAVEQSKEDPLDFVLWKQAKPEEPAWNSPWGRGRPGWHIECSAMAINCLQEQIDIHGGGMDLKFPHHENEIAQSEACTGKPFANIWMHAGFLQVDDEKMSKSLGNFFLLKDALEKFSAEQLRYFMLSSHYGSPINLTEQNLTHAHEALERFYTALRGVEIQKAKANTDYEKAFQEAMDDDFNTPDALAVLFQLAKAINRLKKQNKQQAGELAGLLCKLGGVLGLLQQPVEIFFQKPSKGYVEVTEIEHLIAERNQAREQKNFQKADEIRDQLKVRGVELEDTMSGTQWKIEK